MEKLFEADILRSFLPPPPVICQSLRAGSTWELHFDLANQVQVVLGIFLLRIFQYFSIFLGIFRYLSVSFRIFQYFSVFSVFLCTCCAIRPSQPSASILDGIQRLYHHHCWSIFLNHQIVKGDIWASFWDSLGMWEGCKIWTLYMFTSSFLFRKKSDSRVPLVGPQWCSEEVDPAWRLCLFYVLTYYMRSLLHVLYITYMFCCGFCSKRILLYFPMCVCQCVSHRRDI